MPMQDEVELIIHIGMGKTGTTAIQRSLSDSQTKLAEQSASYLGMWFSFANVSFIGTKRTVDFFKSSKLEKLKYADELLENIHQKRMHNQISKFIISNEQIFANIEHGEVFFERLNRNIKTKFVCFVRNPYDWLQSAHYQWSVKNKTYSGKAKSLKQFSEEIVVRYDKLQNWQELFPNNFSAIQLKKNMNAIDLFCKEVGNNLQSKAEPKNIRGSQGEIVLRNLFNNTFATPVAEQKFNSYFTPHNNPIEFNIDKLIEIYTDPSCLDSIVKSKEETWKFIQDKLNINLLEDGFDCAKFSAASVKNDLINILLSELIRRGIPLSD